MKYEEIKKTPFILITDEDNNRCFAACKNMRITKYYRADERKKVIQEVTKPTWNNILALVKVMIDYNNEEQKNK